MPFLKAIFNHVPENFLINIWTLPDKRSYWIKPGADLPDGLEDRDVYYGPGLAEKAGTSKTRLKSIDVVGFTALWADVDFGEGHKKNVPPDEKTAGELVRECGLHPSLVVHSGHGWHCYWLLDEPWLFTCEPERVQAGNMIKQWQSHIRKAFAKDNYELDSTHDLARVLRVPGFINHKDPDHPQPVEICWPQSWDPQREELKRYTLDDFQKIIGPIKPAPSKPAAGVTMTEGDQNHAGSKNIAVKAKPIDKERFAALMENNDTFKATWEQRRTDLKDSSPSGYDLSLTNQAMAAGWSDGEIVTLLYDWRVKHGHNPHKLNRPDYVKTTLTMARTDAVMDGCGKVDFAITDENRSKVMEKIRKRLEAPMTRVIRRVGEASEYSLVIQTENGEREIVIGGAQALLSLRTVRAKIFDVSGRTIAIMKDAQWFRIVELLFKVAEVIEIEEAREIEQARQWLAQYLDKKSVFDQENWKEALALNSPFRREGTIYLHAEDFTRFIRVCVQSNSYQKGDVLRMLSRLGFVYKKESARMDHNKVVNRGYWHHDEAGLGL